MFQYTKALKYFEVAASRRVLSAEMQIFFINMKLGKTTDANAFFSRLLNEFKEDNYQLQILLHAMEYFLFIQRDLFSALKYFLLIIERDPNYHGLTVSTNY